MNDRARETLAEIERLLKPLKDLPVIMRDLQAALDRLVEARNEQT